MSSRRLAQNIDDAPRSWPRSISRRSISMASVLPLARRHRRRQPTRMLDTGPHTVVVTLGARGALASHARRGGGEHGYRGTGRRTTGAGDTFNAAFVSARWRACHWPSGYASPMLPGRYR